MSTFDISCTMTSPVDLGPESQKRMLALPQYGQWSSIIRVAIFSSTGELGYDGPLYDAFLHMTDDMLGPSPMHIKYSSYVYDGPIFLVPLSPSYPSSPVRPSRLLKQLI